MNELNDPIDLMVRALGPEHVLLGKSRHCSAVRGSMKAVMNRYSPHVDSIVFDLLVGGKLAHLHVNKPIKTGTRRRKLSGDTLFVSIGMSAEDLFLSDDQYRLVFSKVLQSAAVSGTEYVNQKGIKFDSELFLHDIGSILDRYRDGQLVLTPDDVEEQPICYYFGIEQKDIGFQLDLESLKRY